MKFQTMWYVRPAMSWISLRICQSDQSLCLSLEYSMSVKLLTEHHLEVLSLKGGCTGSSESSHVKFVGNHMSQLNYVLQSLKIVSILANSAGSDKMQHFIRHFTVCQCTFYGFL